MGPGSNHRPLVLLWSDTSHSETTNSEGCLVSCDFALEAFDCLMDRSGQTVEWREQSQGSEALQQLRHAGVTFGCPDYHVLGYTVR